MHTICFFVAPIGKPGTPVRARSDRMLEVLVRPAVEPLGYRVIRVDRLPLMGSLSAQIRGLARRADLVIADLTGANPNVLYELGFRHAFDRPCIQLIEEGEQIPFDVADIRTFFIDTSSSASMQRAVPILSQYVSAAGVHGGGPVTHITEEALTAFLERSISESELHYIESAAASSVNSAEVSATADRQAEATGSLNSQPRESEDETILTNDRFLRSPQRLRHRWAWITAAAA